jgi:hypothetical protein
MANKGPLLAESTGTNSSLIYIENTFAPTVTLVGGAGNTVPVYSTNTGRYTRIGNQVFVDIYLTGDGGAEGAGSGQINIALPITSSASHSADALGGFYGVNGGTFYDLKIVVPPSSGTFQVWQGLISAFIGDNQNNASRTMRFKFFYEV